MVGSGRREVCAALGGRRVTAQSLSDDQPEQGRRLKSHTEEDSTPPGTPVCRLCGRYLAILGRPIRITVPAVTVAPTALVGSLIRSSNLPHSLQRGVQLSDPCRHGMSHHTVPGTDRVNSVRGVRPRGPTRQHTTPASDSHLILVLSTRMTQQWLHYNSSRLPLNPEQR